MFLGIQVEPSSTYTSTVCVGMTWIAVQLLGSHGHAAALMSAQSSSTNGSPMWQMMADDSGQTPKIVAVQLHF